MTDAADRYRERIDELDVAVRTPIPQEPPPRPVTIAPPPDRFDWADWWRAVRVVLVYLLLVAAGLTYLYLKTR